MSSLLNTVRAGAGRQKRKFLIIALLTVIAAGCQNAVDSGDAVSRAFQENRSNVAVTGEGIVTRILADDRSGISHQRFLVRIGSGGSVLIDHHIDIAPRIDDLKVSDTVGFSGEYIWNEQGGLIHWTHHDPADKHPAGWLLYNGRKFQ